MAARLQESIQPRTSYNISLTPEAYFVMKTYVRENGGTMEAFLSEVVLDKLKVVKADKE